MTDAAVHAKRSVPFVQANLIATENDDPAIVARWREDVQRTRRLGQRAGAAVSLPGLAGLPRSFGARPTTAPGNARVDYYLDRYSSFSDIQEAQPRRLAELERPAAMMRPDRDSRLTVLMTADAVGGVWTYALGLCSALPDIRFVLAMMGPRSQRRAMPCGCGTSQCDARNWRLSARMDAGRSRRNRREPPLANASRARARRRSGACQRLCAGEAAARSPRPGRSAFRRTVVVAGGARHARPRPNGMPIVATSSPASPLRMRWSCRAGRCSTICGATTACRSPIPL